MLRDIDSVLANHRQISAASAVPSLIELMLKLVAAPAPNLQGADRDETIQWDGSVHLEFGRIAIHSFNWDRAGFCRLINEQLIAGRPVGILMKPGTDPDDSRGERGWVAIGLHEIGQYHFVDLAGKIPEQGSGEGHFTEKRSIRLDEILDGQISLALYCQELQPSPRTHRRRRAGTNSRLARMPIGR